MNFLKVIYLQFTAQLELTSRWKGNTIVEVQQLLGDNKVRAVSMRSTDGLRRGVEAVDLGAPISVPVGTTTLGRIFNVIGEPVDEQGDVS